MVEDWDDLGAACLEVFYVGGCDVGLGFLGWEGIGVGLVVDYEILGVLGVHADYWLLGGALCVEGDD